MIPKRICITTKDVMNIKGCSSRNAREILSDIKAYYKKEEKKKLVTFKEFSIYTGIAMEEIERFID
jgi:hypothetical protein